jgi:hypothetical protein
MKRRLIAGAAAVLGTVLIGGIVVPTTASAVDPVPVPTTVTLPLFGAPLTIDITTGPGGTLTDVAVDSANSTVATKLKPHKVVFENTNAAGDVGKVVVKSKHGGQSVSARAGTLEQVSGPGSWSGDLFGDGTASTVAFTIGGSAADPTVPDITGITTTGAAAVVGDVKHSTSDDDDETGMSARVSIKFTNTDGDQSRTVSIRVSVHTDEDGDTSAKVSLSVGGIKGVAVAAADAVGTHTWSGVLCDNSPATIAYDVALDGSVSNVVVTPDGADVRTGDNKIDVRFSHDERVRIRVSEDDGLIKISVDERIRCRDAADPTTNATTTVPADDDDANENDGNHHGHGGGNNDDDATSTTVASG